LRGGCAATSLLDSISKAYLDEFVFRWNRRRQDRESFDMLLGIAVGIGPFTYWSLTAKQTPLAGLAGTPERMPTGTRLLAP